MLEKIDLAKKLEKDIYKKQAKELSLSLGELQRKAKDLKVPVMVILEGWNAAGKGTLLNRVLMCLDPRGFTVYNTKASNEEERFRPFLWRFWAKTPARGHINFYDRSWYRRVTQERMDNVITEKEWHSAYDEINSFERQLVDDDAVIIKLFLHIGKKEQKKRLEDMESDTTTKWKVTAEDWKHHKQYELYYNVFEEMFDKTDTDYAPWLIVEAEDTRFATIKIYRKIINALENKIAEKMEQERMKTAMLATKSDPDVNAKNAAAQSIKQDYQLSTTILDKIDLSKTMTREEYQKELKICQKKIRDIEHGIYEKRIPITIAFEGWDAAGKGGNIKRLTENMDPRGYDVWTFASPTPTEKAHQHLWRFWQHIPKAGHIAIFDRTWYGRVLVERVEGFCSKVEWKRAYREINDMEWQWANYGTEIFKFWLHIDKEEQLNRFNARVNDPGKQYKITDEDWRNREKWDEYKAAVDEMLVRTDTKYAPWTIVEANSKYYARIKVLKTIIERMDKIL